MRDFVSAMYCNSIVIFQHRCISKGPDFSTLTDPFIRRIQYKINRHPRKKLNFDSPKNVFFRPIANFAPAS